MSPYEILGIRHTASVDEAETAYRARLRECHPDLHVHAGPDAVAWAEQRTRELNAAIRAIRTQPRVVVGHAGEEFGRQHGFQTGAGSDWFGNPVRGRPSIHCVLCGLRVDEPSSYRRHLLLDHAFVERVRRRHTHSVPQWMSWIPAPMFWSLLLLVLYCILLFGIFGDSTLSIAGLWFGVLAYLLFLPVAYKAERYRRRF